MSAHSKNEHGSVKSYIVGFILSLVFTLIPYFLVVSETASGNALLFVILTFALIQMIIQVTFFLHLGRGPKPNWNLFFFVATVLIVAMVVGGSVMIMNNLHYNMSPEEKVKKLINDEGIYQVSGIETGACQGKHDNHIIVIENDQTSPSVTITKHCDTLTFVNKDDKERQITFGTHPNHGSYAGEDEIEIRPGKSETITLSETGTYSFHDHFQPEINGQFSVTSEE